MLRKVLVAAGTVALSATVVVVGSGGLAGASGPPHAKGTVLCGISSGSGTLSPGLTVAGSPGGVKINFAAKFSTGNCTSKISFPTGVSVVGGSITGSGAYNPPPASGIGSSCAAFDGSDVVSKIVVHIHWVTTPPAAIANTKVVYKNNTGTVSGSPTDTIDLMAPTGTAVKSGSFSTPAGAPPNQTLLTTNIPAPPPGPCPVSPPFTNFTISGGAVQM